MNKKIGASYKRAADIANRFATVRRDSGLPADFPNDEDLSIAEREYQISGSMLSALRAVRDWREAR